MSSQLGSLAAEKESIIKKLSGDPYRPYGTLGTGVPHLPTEVLEMIFGFAAANFSHSTARPPFKMIISLVCKHFLAVAYNTPELWADIRMTSKEDGTERIKIHLARSKDRLLSVSVDLTHDAFVDNAEVIERQWKMLVGEVHRWQRLEFRTECLRYFDPLLSSLSGLDAPKLESLQICSTTSTRNTAEHEFFDVDAPLFLAAPSLRRLRLHGTAFPGFNKCSLVNVTHVDLLSPPDNNILDYTDLHAFLSSLPGLESLAYGGSLAFPHYRFDEYRRTLPLMNLGGLRYLRLACADPGSFCTLLSAPQLLCLVLDAKTVENKHMQLSLLREALCDKTQGFNNITTLKLWNFGSGDIARLFVPPVLRNTCQVEHVTIVETDAAALFNGLLPRGTLDLPWPRLRSLTLSNCISAPELFRFIVGRRYSGYEIPSLVIRDYLLHEYCEQLLRDASNVDLRYCWEEDLDIEKDFDV
ncbi:hypothetical protein GLOTRDRAFT_96110 [Gloeophyllum trabeum ATCC 11539]|uniref:Uncharacterized protein n=1 Tax=Gloeophyllum trabeum (strain ATCC 11539 / FP-39264 / Madison 617) TaxID=670483 RepID=S7RCC7_GLOTA|nr:uncharacterized protein GLOTRDRAFT_96110 [Gloeophyllum trabeum ATCC 11539]EPQ51875.1 hypothetical protein GLOTRDRAFT_96110 [Gloeophyllum trabeum ATCC 11539]